MKFIKAFVILLKSYFFKKDVYHIHFIKVNRLWYCDIPNWPKAFFDNAQMVAGAARLLEILAEGKDEVTLEVAFNEKYLNGSVNSYNKARRTGHALTRGAFYDVISLNFMSNIWIFPVTLFVLGKYPEYIYFKTI